MPQFPHLLILAVACITSVNCHEHHYDHTEDQFSATRLNDLASKWGIDWGFSGISTFAHLPHVRCLTNPAEEFDIAILGAPFDTAVSYRPGARFGPRAIRAASARQTSFRGFNPRAGFNPYASWATILDCGDIPITPVDNALALRQMSEAYVELGSRRAKANSSTTIPTYRAKPKIVTLGGDHSIALPALRALHEIYGEPISVLHFDAHLDTWDPTKYPSSWLDEPASSSPASSLSDGSAGGVQSYFTHGSMFWLASKEGIIANGSSVHAGLRTRLTDEGDWEDDTAQGWTRISADDLDDLGTKGVISSILAKLGTERPVYLSVDIDVLDPGFAPGTGTPEPGGWTTRELIRILRGVEGLNVVGADVVEVAPAYDNAGEVTALAAAQVVYEIITSMVRRGGLETDSQPREGQQEVKTRSTAERGPADVTGEKDEL